MDIRTYWNPDASPTAMTSAGLSTRWDPPSLSGLAESRQDVLGILGMITTPP
ncbi:MAG: hypothetical protein GKR86_02375 [Ilumatobacter sp.]|nr:hypothetical protein [Ilumatobacter sp.]